MAPPCPLSSERAPGVLIVRRRESGRGLGPSLPYVITASPSPLALPTDRKEKVGRGTCRAAMICLVIEAPQHNDVISGEPARI